MVSLNFYDPEDRPWPNPRLTNASIIGHTTSRSVRLWFRVSQAGDYWLILSKHPLPTSEIPEIQGEGDQAFFIIKNPQTPQETAIELITKLSFVLDNDLTHLVEINHLNADTRYYYALFQVASQEWILGHQEPLSFQTFPQTLEALNFGIYSCHMPYEGRKIVSQDMWKYFYEKLSEFACRFVLAMGDQVYVDGSKDLSIWEWLRKVKQQSPSREEMVTWYRDIYKGYWGFSDIQKIFNAFPTYMIWDDHEIFDGWGSYTPKELASKLDTSWQLRDTEAHLRLANEMFLAAKQVYQEYEHCHNPATDLSLEQFDYEFKCGEYAFYTLDMRGHHDFNRQEWRLLGYEQWQRFATWIDAQHHSNARALFIIIPVPVVHLHGLFVNSLDIPYLEYTDDLRDHWEHESNWQERNHLLAKIFEFSQQRQRPVIMLSGDVHLGAAFQIFHDDYPHAKVFQITSSGIAYAGLTPMKRKILEKLVPEEGKLSDFQQNQPYYFQRLLVCRQNNFGILRVNQTESHQISISFDLFSQSDESEETFNQQSLELPLNS